MIEWKVLVLEKDTRELVGSTCLECVNKDDIC